jgi:hypothetical protein
MPKKQHTEEQIISALRRYESGETMSAGWPIVRHTPKEFTDQICFRGC